MSSLTAHLVLSTKYRYTVLHGKIQTRCRTILIQICDTEDEIMLKGVVSKDHVYIHVSYRPSQSLSQLVKRLKGRSSRKLQQEFHELGKKYWGQHFGQLALAVGVLEISLMKW